METRTETFLRPDWWVMTLLPQPELCGFLEFATLFWVANRWQNFLEGWECYNIEKAGMDSKVLLVLVNAFCCYFAIIIFSLNWPKKKFQFFSVRFDIGANIRISWEIQCLPYAGLFSCPYRSPWCFYWLYPSPTKSNVSNTGSLFIVFASEIMVITERTFHCFYIFSSRVFLTLGRRMSFIGGERDLLNCPAADQQDSSTVYSVQCTVDSVQCTVYSVQLTVYSGEFTGNSVKWTEESVQSTICSVQLRVYW